MIAAKCPKCGLDMGVVLAPSGEVLFCPGCDKVAGSTKADEERTARRDEIEKKALSSAGRQATRDIVDMGAKITTTAAAAAAGVAAVINSLQHPPTQDVAPFQKIADDFRVVLAEYERHEYEVRGRLRFENDAVLACLHIACVEPKLVVFQKFGPCLLESEVAMESCEPRGCKVTRTTAGVELCKHEGFIGILSHLDLRFKFTHVPILRGDARELRTRLVFRAVSSAPPKGSAVAEDRWTARQKNPQREVEFGLALPIDK